MCHTPRPRARRLAVWLLCFAALAASCAGPSPLGGAGSDDGGASDAAWTDALAGADAAAPDPHLPDTDTPDTDTSDTHPADSQAPSAATVHACATFTVLQDSTGQAVAGVQHAEEALPSFVHRRDVGAPGSDAAQVLTAGVTFKLQTPVVFVQSPAPEQLTLTVELPTGVLSAFWPKATTQQPPPKDALAPEKGALTWSQLAVQPGAIPGPSAGADSLWKQLQTGDGTPVTLAGEAAPFVFYQGLGTLDPQVTARTVAVANETKLGLEVTNHTGSTIPVAWYVHVHAGGGMITRIGSVPDGVTRQGGITPKEVNYTLFSEAASKALAQELQQAGLSASEAGALVKSWSHNYFKTPGRRLLYIAPPSWAAKHLPMTVTPTPKAKVRVLVGRVEVLSPGDEAALVDSVKAASQSGSTALVGELGVFAEAKLRRAVALLPAGAAKSHGETLVGLAAKLP